MRLKTQPTGDVTVTIQSSDEDVVLYDESNEGVITFTEQNWFQDQTITLNGVGAGDAVLTVTGSEAGDYDVEDTLTYFRSPKGPCDRDEGVTDPNECECPVDVPVKCGENRCVASEEHCTFISGASDQSNMNPNR